MGTGGAIGGALGTAYGIKKANKTFSADKENYGTPPIFWKGGPWEQALTGPNNLLAQNALALLKSNGLSALEPALRSATTQGQSNQRRYSDMLARSGLIGSGLQMGGSNAIQNQTDVNRSNILAQLPNIQRENLQALYPYFARYLTNKESRVAGLDQYYRTRAASQAGAASAITGAAGGGGGKGGGNAWQGPGGQTAPAGGGGK